MRGGIVAAAVAALLACAESALAGELRIEPRTPFVRPGRVFGANLVWDEGGDVGIEGVVRLWWTLRDGSGHDAVWGRRTVRVHVLKPFRFPLRFVVPRDPSDGTYRLDVAVRWDWGEEGESAFPLAASMPVGVWSRGVWTAPDEQTIHGTLRSGGPWFVSLFVPTARRGRPASSASPTTSSAAGRRTRCATPCGTARG